jgi:hypothetical protein
MDAWYEISVAAAFDYCHRLQLREAGPRRGATMSPTQMMLPQPFQSRTYEDRIIICRGRAQCERADTGRAHFAPHKRER